MESEVAVGAIFLTAVETVLAFFVTGILVGACVTFILWLEEKKWNRK